jgi:membrane-associated phospholipid phosphatase
VARAASRRDRRPYRRRTGDAVGLVVGLVVFVATAALADQGLAPLEAGTFEAVNGLPDALYVVIWPFMQYGVFVTIPVLTVIALLFRRFRLAGAMAVAGVGVYLLARVVKEFVERGRPDALLDGVDERETFAEASLGFPSGHAAVAGALTVVVTPHLHGRWKLLPAALLVIVCIGRMYVAAHLPLDLLGGAALGAAAGFAANLAVGVPSQEVDEPAISPRS